MSLCGSSIVCSRFCRCRRPSLPRLGQCGNQVGAACFEGLASQLLAPASTGSTSAASGKPTLARPSHRTPFQQSIARRFFREADSNGAETAGSDVALPRARAVLVDMEPKVIQQALLAADQSRLFRYTASSSFYRQSGSGNNWSYGFGVHGPQCREEILDRVRRETERCSSLGGFVVHQSLAGGTGSGVGAYLTECMHDEYPGEQLINQVVWPYANGEVIVQNYNALLTLAHLNEVGATRTRAIDRIIDICVFMPSPT
jgi:tubulin delta